MKIVIAVESETVLVLWKGNNLPYVVATVPECTLNVGDTINEWYWGHYFKTLEEAFHFFKKED